MNKQRMQTLAGLIKENSLNEMPFFGKKRTDITDAGLRDKFLTIVNTASDGIETDRDALLKNFSKKMMAKYAPPIEEFFKQYIGQPLPQQIVDSLRSGNPQFKSKTIPYRLENVKVWVIGTGLNSITIVVDLDFEDFRLVRFNLYTTSDGVLVRFRNF